LIFIGMVNIVLRMAQGEGATEQTAAPPRESWWEIAPPVVLMVLVLVFGLYVPQRLNNTLHRAAVQVGAGSPAGTQLTETVDRSSAPGPLSGITESRD
jgi:formate hydrogenlyase subunit 3/multisubunit Na+/H+ antiporter MnhD subunit